MKAIIKKVTHKKEYETKFGMMHSFEILFDEKKAYYQSKEKNQTKFVEGSESEFDVEEMVSDKGKYFILKPIYKKWQGNSNYGRAIKKEQSKYSGFAVSYAKDLCIADKIKFVDLPQYATVLFNLMVELDKSIENDKI